MQRSVLCRSRRELSNAYILAKFGFDTAENEPWRFRQTRYPPSMLPLRFPLPPSTPFGPSLRTTGLLLIGLPWRPAVFGLSATMPLTVHTWVICTRRAGKLYEARSRLYRRRFLQVNTRWNKLSFRKEDWEKGHGERPSAAGNRAGACRCAWTCVICHWNFGLWNTLALTNVATLANLTGLVLGCIDDDFYNQNTFFAAFFEIYKIFTILRRSNLKILQNSSKISWLIFEEKNHKILEKIEILQILIYYYYYHETFDEILKKM